jgi:hypothetical protein
MSFKHEHYEMSHVIEYTERAKQRQDVTFTGREPANDYDGKLVDGLWLCKECANIVAELRKKHPDMKIGANRDVRTWSGMLSDAVVYREGEPYALGRIGHGDIGVSTTDYKYYILSRKLRKARGGWGRWQNYVKASVEMKTVLKYVKEGFVSYAPAEIANMSVEEFTKSIRSERNIASNMTQNAWRQVASELGNELRDELCAMVADGYQFRNHKITESIAAYIQAKASKAEVDAKRLDAYFMVVGDSKTTVIEYEGLESTTKAKEYTEVSTQDIPYDLQFKIASLQVASPMHYVEDLGMRVSDRTFWVQR